MDYDDESEVTRFVWDHYQHLMTDFDRSVGRAIIGRKKTAGASPAMACALNESWGRLGDPEIDAALADGSETFRRQVSHRLLVHHGSALNVNRCPSCKRVVRTLKARQCFWCGHDWH